MAELDDIATMDVDSLDAAAQALEVRRLAAHVAFKAEGMAINTRRSELAATARVAAMTSEERAVLAAAIAAHIEPEPPEPIED